MAAMLVVSLILLIGVSGCDSYRKISWKGAPSFGTNFLEFNEREHLNEMAAMLEVSLILLIGVSGCDSYRKISWKGAPSFGTNFLEFNEREHLNEDDTVEIELQCPSGMAAKDEDGKPRCVDVQLENQEVIEYNLQLLLYSPNFTGNAESLKREHNWLTFCPHIQVFAAKLSNVSIANRFRFNFGLFDEGPQWWKQWSSSSIPLYLSINFEVEMNNTHLFKDNIIDSLGKELLISVDDEDVEMKYKVFNGSYSMDVLMRGVSKENSGESCSFENGPLTEFMPRSRNSVFHEMSCQYADFYECEDYRVVEDGLRLRFEDLETESEVIASSEYTFQGDDMITICWETYKEYQQQTRNIIQKAKSQIRETEWFVNVLFLTCSLVGLFCTFLTYCTFPVLRMLPAKNNIGLIVSLFMAQLMYIIGFRHTDNFDFCLTTAVALHYFWLAAIFWMSVCCFHVFKGFVLSKTISTASESHRATLSRYITFAHGLPVLIILAVVSTNLVLSEGKETGYVGRNCFLSSVFLNGLTVTLPLCLVLLSNFIFFTATICTISRTKQIRRNTGGERRNMWIYIKLSSITGLFWIMAILAAALQVEALGYVSTILNSSQGVFLFFSYCCNKRVLTLWRNKLTWAEDHTATSDGNKSRTTQETPASQDLQYKKALETL